MDDQYDFEEGITGPIIRLNGQIINENEFKQRLEETGLYNGFRLGVDYCRTKERIHSEVFLGFFRDEIRVEDETLDGVAKFNA